jgi:Na+-transporting methylmalonyl-CoA/oxaloacetate decarboxylase gamma subunit
MNVGLFLQTLPYMVKGLAGVFAVTLLIMLCIALLNRFTASKDGEERR